MTSTWIFFIILHLVSLAFAMLTLWRLYEYIKRYRFDESKYTLLFGCLHLRWIAAGYMIVVSLWIFVSFSILDFV